MHRLPAAGHIAIIVDDHVPVSRKLVVKGLKRLDRRLMHEDRRSTPPDAGLDQAIGNIVGQDVLHTLPHIGQPLEGSHDCSLRQ